MGGALTRMLGRPAGGAGPYSFNTATAYKSAAATSTASPVSYDNEALDTGTIWSAGSPTQFITPSNATYVRFVANQRAATTVTAQTLSSQKNGTDYIGKLMGFGYSSSATSLGNAASAIVPVSAGDAFTVLNPSGNTYGFEQTWASLETIDPTMGRGLFTNSANQNLTNGAWIGLTFDTEVYDTQAVHSTSSNTGRITIPSGTSGIIRIGAGAQATANANNFALRIRKNGTTTIANHFSQAGSAGRFCCTYSYPIAVTAGDYFEVEAYVDNTSIQVAANEGVWFQYEELPGAMKYCVVTMSGTGDTVGTDTSEDILWNAEIVDTHGFHSTVTNTQYLTIPSGQGITQARISYCIDSLAGGRFMVFSGKVGASNAAGAPFSAVTSSVWQGQSGFGAWMNVADGDQFFLQAYGVARTFGISASTWFAIETR
jgi:hypothetical protein